ncbi:hypothetical protein GCM10025794_00750 [Massilia kyonggiensis]
MSQYTFEVGKQYKRDNVSALVGDGGTTTGNWSTGYPQKDGVTFIFCNVGSAGQTGHDYDNKFDGLDLIWRGRTGSRREHSSIQRMIHPDAEVHVFWRSNGRDPFTYAGLAQAVEVTDEVPVRVRWKLSATEPDLRLTPVRRLPASELNKIRADHIWEAVQLLLDGYQEHPFADSTDYDVLADDGKRLPPKAVFGIAAKLALGFEVLPLHFTAGLSSPCFRIIEAAGFPIVVKNEQETNPTLKGLSFEDQQWCEGKEKLVLHIKRERSRGAAEAKKAQFKQKFGKLYCEKCGLDPVEKYGTLHAESCIEVHHKHTQVRDMESNHTTKLDSLECLCANCHRLEHKLLKGAI